MKRLEYMIIQTKSTLQSEQYNLKEAVESLDIVIKNKEYHYSPGGQVNSWLRGTPVAIAARITALLAKIEELQRQLDEENQ